MNLREKILNLSGVTRIYLLSTTLVLVGCTKSLNEPHYATIKETRQLYGPKREALDDVNDGLLSERKGDHLTAQEKFRSAILLPMEHLFLAESLDKSGDAKQAYAEYETAFAPRKNVSFSVSNETYFRFRMGELALATGKPEEADPEYKKAIATLEFSVGPSKITDGSAKVGASVRSLATYAASLSRAGNGTEEVNLLASAVKLSPDWAFGHLAYGALIGTFKDPALGKSEVITAIKSGTGQTLTAATQLFREQFDRETMTIMDIHNGKSTVRRERRGRPLDYDLYTADILSEYRGMTLDQGAKFLRDHPLPLPRTFPPSSSFSRRSVNDPHSHHFSGSPPKG